VLWQQLPPPPPTPSAGQIEYTSLVAVLIAGIVTLWKALAKKDDQIQTLTKEMITHTDSLNQIPPALDRLRTDVTGKLDRLHDDLHDGSEK